MNAKAAICKALLLGKVLNGKVGPVWFGITNTPREIDRCVERAFGVKCDRKQRTGKTRFDVSCWWTDYRLKATEENKPGIVKMIEYVVKKEGVPKTQQQAADRSKLEMLQAFCQAWVQSGTLQLTEKITEQ